MFYHLVSLFLDKVDRHYRKLEFGQGLSLIFEVLYDANKYVTDNEPWKLRKIDPIRCQTVIYISLEAARLCALLLQPVMPQSSSRMLDMLGVGPGERDASYLVYGRAAGAPLKKQILFTKVKSNAD